MLRDTLHIDLKSRLIRYQPTKTYVWIFENADTKTDELNLPKSWRHVWVIIQIGLQ